MGSVAIAVCSPFLLGECKLPESRDHIFLHLLERHLVALRRHTHTEQPVPSSAPAALPIKVSISSIPCQGFPGDSAVKDLPATQEMQIRSLDWEDPLEEGMATHSSMLVWEIPWTEEPDKTTVHKVAGSDRTEAAEHT